MKKVGAIAIVLLSLCCLSSAQTSNTFNAAQFAGNDVGTKVTAAQNSCNANTSVPCVIILDPILAAYSQGTMPARCAQCTWIDYRTSGSVSFSGSSGSQVLSGAVCDGVTDATVAIQAAITSAANSSLVIPAGLVCGVGSQLTVTAPIKIFLYGTLKPVTAGVAGTPLILASASNVSFDCGGVGGINGNSKAWNGIRILGATFLDDGAVENCSFVNVAPASSQAEVIGLYSIRKGVVRNNHITTSGVTAATTGGGFGIYTQYCFGCTIDKNYLDTVGSTGINVSAGVGNRVVNNRLLKATLFALKGGYGLPGTVSADAAGTTTSFTVTKNSTTTKAYAIGQYVTIVRTATTTCDGYIKSVTDNSTFYTIGTTTMGCTPSSGDTVEMPDTGTVIDSNEVTFTAADALDFNITKDITISNNHFVLAGLYTGAGGAIVAVNSCIWVGADPQTIVPFGSIHPFKSDGVKIHDNHCTHAGSSGIVVYESDNVSVTGNVVSLVNEAGNDATPTTDPQFGCIEVGRIGFNRHFQINISHNTCQTSVGYAFLANFTWDTVISGNVGKAPFGMKADAQIAAHIDGNMIEATAANCYGLRLGDPSAGNPSSSISMTGNDIRGNVASCNALKQTDAAAGLINEVGQNFWTVSGGTAISTAVTIGSGTPNAFAATTLRLSVVAPTVAAGQVGLGSTTATTVGAAGGAAAPPATPVGYLIVNIGGTNFKIPYYTN